MVNDDVDIIAMVSDVCAMISEVNLSSTIDNGQKLYMGNSATILQLLISRAKEIVRYETRSPLIFIVYNSL
ncbi:hypothetical protein Tco_0388311 [Tanacetum coccineum]